MAIAIVVPRSGSSATSAQMTSASTPIGLASSFTVRGGRFRAASTAAAKTRIASFGELRRLDGDRAGGDPALGAVRADADPRHLDEDEPARWRQHRNGPATRRRRYESRAAAAMHATPGQRVAPLAHERAERVVALHDGDPARRAVDHDQAERDEAERQQEQQVVLDVRPEVAGPAWGPAPWPRGRIRRHPQPPARDGGTSRRGPRSPGTGRSWRRRARAAPSRRGERRPRRPARRRRGCPTARTATPAASRAAARRSAAWPIR